MQSTVLLAQPVRFFIDVEKAGWDEPSNCRSVAAADTPIASLHPGTFSFPKMRG